MGRFFRNLRLDVKIAILGIGSVLITAIALVILAVWQSGEYNTLAQREVDELIGEDLNHITDGVYHLVKTENEAVQEQVNYNLNVARHVLTNKGGASLSKENVQWTATNQFTHGKLKIQLPKMVIEGRWLGQNTAPDIKTPVVDEITHLVGETATIFQRMNKRGDMMRVATTVKNAEGKRAIGTFIPAIGADGKPNTVISTILKGEIYRGRAFVVNAWYLTAYEPIRDQTGRLIGMLYVGVKQKAVEMRIRHAILQTKVGKTGYVYVLAGKGEDRGHYIISQEGARDGEDIWDNRDSDGRYVIRAIINRAITLKPGEKATVRYRWQNPGEPAPRWKIARLVYYEPWDWVIGTSVYEDELQVYRSILSGGRIKMITIMGIAGLVLILVIGLMGIFFAWTIRRPVGQLTQAAQNIMNGDLQHAVDIHSQDEIGALARSFNTMTDRLRQTMEGLQKSEEKYRTLVETTSDLIFIVDRQGRLTFANPRLETLTGFSFHELQGKPFTDILLPEIRETELGRLEKGIRGETIAPYEVVVVDKAGKETPVEILSATLSGPDGRPIGRFGVGRDITERKRAEEMLRQSESNYRSVIENIQDVVYRSDTQGRFTMVSPSIVDLLGYDSTDEFLGKAIADVFYYEPEKRIEFLKILREKGKVSNYEVVLKRKDGVPVIVEANSHLYFDKEGHVAGVEGTFRDITARKHDEEIRRKLESQLLQSQKTEAIGTLAGGIAHDFNNILTGIMGYSELYIESVADRPKIHRGMEEILKAAGRAKDLVKQILTFSRQTDHEKKPVQLTPIIREVIKFMRASLPTTIEIKQVINEVPDIVWADPSQMHQVLMNLCTNAWHAMKDSGGVLEIILKEVVIDDPQLVLHKPLKPGRYLELSVLDTGKGIPKEIMDKIFDPYFTTKKQGEGTGLGLAVVHGIVKECGGDISVYSEPDKGAIFKIYLPVLDSPIEEAIDRTEEIMPGRGETILFIDDEKMVADMNKALLESIGYRVIAETDPVHAIETFRKDYPAFDLVITDKTMPHLTGYDVIQAVRSICSGIPIILCSGFQDKEDSEKIKALGINQIVIKPVRKHVMAKTIRDILDHSDHGP